MTSGVESERAAEAAAARPLYVAFVGEVRHVAQRLNSTTTLAAADVERAVAEVANPTLSLGLLELAVADDRVDPMAFLVSTLVLRRAVKGTAHEEPWSAVLGEAASRAAYELRLPGLLELRLGLLDDLIAHPDGVLSLAELHFQRANTRQALSVNDGRATQAVVEDLQCALELARVEGNVHVCAVATAVWAKIVGATHLTHPGLPEIHTALEGHLTAVLALPVSASERALLYQARATMVRSSKPDEALRLLEDALATVPLVDPLRTELAAQLVAVLVALRRPKDAAMRGLAFLAEPAHQPHGVLLGMLHLSVGQALTALQRVKKAREHLIAGLELVRGRDRRNEVLARFLLASLGLSEGNMALVDEHLRILEDRRDELDEAQRIDLVELCAAAAAMRGNPEAERQALDAAVLLARGEPRTTQLRLRRAWAGLTAGESVGDLDVLLIHAITLKPPHSAHVPPPSSTTKRHLPARNRRTGCESQQAWVTTS